MERGRLHYNEASMGIPLTILGVLCVLSLVCMGVLIVSFRSITGEREEMLARIGMDTVKLHARRSRIAWLYGVTSVLWVAIFIGLFFSSF